MAHVLREIQQAWNLRDSELGIGETFGDSSNSIYWATFV